VFVAAWQTGIREIAGFTPHVMVLLYVTLDNLSGGDCDTYYSHPNGSIGQMTLEAIAFAAVGISILMLHSRRTNGRLLAILLAWNGFSVAVFYVGLAFTNHWTWSHTWFIFLVQALVAIAVALSSRRRRTSLAARYHGRVRERNPIVIGGSGGWECAAFTAPRRSRMRRWSAGIAGATYSSCVRLWSASSISSGGRRSSKMRSSNSRRVLSRR
jgi:hypothetical protein